MPVEIPEHAEDVGILGADAIAQIIKVLREDRMEVGDGGGLFVGECAQRSRLPIPTKPPGYNGIMPPGIPE